MSQQARLAHLSHALQALKTGAAADAVREAEAALAIDAADAETQYVAGLAYGAAGDWLRAADSLGRAVAARGKISWRWAYGRALSEARQDTAAEQVLREILAAKPDHVPSLIELASLCNRQRRLEEALALCRRGVEIAPEQAEFWGNYGNALMGLDRLPEAAEMYHRMIAINPGIASINSNLLFCSNYRADISAEAVFAEYQRWNDLFGKPHLPQPLRHDNDKSPQRRLKIGYVSPDFYQHVVAMFFEPLLLERDRAAFEVYLYGDVARPDGTTERLKGQADHWRSLSGLSDDAAAALVRADGIDVLVDLAGHTLGNRLGVFARKPAPVQFSYLIGQGYTTGLSAVDGFFADDAMVPPGSEHLFSEQIIRLGRVPLVYQVPQGMPEVGPLPAQRNGHVTFGCFSRTVRLNDRVLALWSALLLRVPHARLVLNAKPFAEAATRAAFEQRFAAHGIGADRLELIYTNPQTKTWAHYNEIDIALDPFPHNAGTTTIEALWMGVPVLSKADRPSVGRFGASILGALGMEDWVTENEAEFVAIGERWANNLEGLAALRAGLRPRFAASPLRDGAGLVRAIEAGYRQLWRAWCSGRH